MATRGSPAARSTARLRPTGGPSPFAAATPRPTPAGGGAARGRRPAAARAATERAFAHPPRLPRCALHPRPDPPQHGEYEAARGLYDRALALDAALRRRGPTGDAAVAAAADGAGWREYDGAGGAGLHHSPATFDRPAWDGAALTAGPSSSTPNRARLGDPVRPLRALVAARGGRVIRDASRRWPACSRRSDARGGPGPQGRAAAGVRRAGAADEPARLFATTLTTIPTRSPLAAEEGLRTLWRERLRAAARPSRRARLGRQPESRQRSQPLAAGAAAGAVAGLLRPLLRRSAGGRGRGGARRAARSWPRPATSRILPTPPRSWPSSTW